MSKVGYEKPILVKLGFDNEAKGTNTCTAGPTFATRNCNIGESAWSKCIGGTSFAQPTVCIPGPANVS